MRQVSHWPRICLSRQSWGIQGQRAAGRGGFVREVLEEVSFYVDLQAGVYKSWQQMREVSKVTRAQGQEGSGWVSCPEADPFGWISVNINGFWTPPCFPKQGVELSLSLGGWEPPEGPLRCCLADQLTLFWEVWQWVNHRHRRGS